MNMETLTAAQIQQACALLGWRSAMLARRSGIAYTAAMQARTEDGFAALPFMDMWMIRTTLERAGVRFVLDAEGKPGAELRASQP